jgi:hypothetical protein
MASTTTVAMAIMPSPEHRLTMSTCAEKRPIFPVCAKLTWMPCFTLRTRWVSLSFFTSTISD